MREGRTKRQKEGKGVRARERRGIEREEKQLEIVRKWKETDRQEKSKGQR